MACGQGAWSQIGWEIDPGDLVPRTCDSRPAMARTRGTCWYQSPLMLPVSSQARPSMDTDAVDELARGTKECDDLLWAICVRRILIALNGAATQATET